MSRAGTKMVFISLAQLVFKLDISLGWQPFWIFPIRRPREAPVLAPIKIKYDMGDPWAKFAAFGQIWTKISLTPLTILYSIARWTISLSKYIMTAWHDFSRYIMTAWHDFSKYIMTAWHDFSKYIMVAWHDFSRYIMTAWHDFSRYIMTAWHRLVSIH